MRCENWQTHKLKTHTEEIWIFQSLTLSFIYISFLFVMCYAEEHGVANCVCLQIFIIYFDWIHYRIKLQNIN